MALRTGFIGLGNIGRPMAERQAAAGLPLVVHDIFPGAREGLEARGATWLPSPAAVAASADVVGVCVRDDDQVNAVIAGSGGILEGASPGLVVAVHSTVLPRTVRDLAARAGDCGVVVIDAPVTGGAHRAATGHLCAMVGGPAEALERCRPAFQAWADRIVHCGPLGSGLGVKLCNNLMSYMAFLAAFEADLLARAAGLSVEALEEVATHNGVLTEQMKLFLAGRRARYDAPGDEELERLMRGFTELAEKDLATALALAREVGAALPGTALCQQLMARVYGIRDERKR